MTKIVPFIQLSLKCQVCYEQDDETICMIEITNRGYNDDSIKCPRCGRDDIVIDNKTDWEGFA